MAGKEGRVMAFESGIEMEKLCDTTTPASKQCHELKTLLA